MFAVAHVLISDAVLDAPFACHLSKCLGGCCVDGERGAPLEPDERAELDAALPVVAQSLRPEALRTIAREGVWEGDRRAGYATTTVGGRECVFVVYDGSPGRAVAKCALQKAHREGRLAFEKPISCHLYPLRVERYGDGPDAVEVLNVERIPLCRPAVPHGARLGVQLADFLERPLTRKYGAAWYARFRRAWIERRAALAPATLAPASGSAPAT